MWEFQYAIQKCLAIPLLPTFVDLMEPKRLEALAKGVRRGDRRELARAITIVESARQEDHAKTAALFDKFRIGNLREALLGMNFSSLASRTTLIDYSRRLTLIEWQGVDLFVHCESSHNASPDLQIFNPRLQLL